MALAKKGLKKKYFLFYPFIIDFWRKKLMDNDFTIMAISSLTNKIIL